MINVFFQDDDIDFDSALETFDRIGSFDISEINVKEPHFIKDVMHFDKQAFYYWLDDGVVEIALEMGQNLTGTWRTMDESATGKNWFLIFLALKNLGKQPFIFSKKLLQTIKRQNCTWFQYDWDSSLWK